MVINKGVNPLIKKVHALFSINPNSRYAVSCGEMCSGLFRFVLVADVQLVEYV